MKDDTSPGSILARLGLTFRELGYGRHLYRQAAASCGRAVQVYWDGVQAGMGVHVQISGEGCRLIEAQEGFPGWMQWIEGWLKAGASFTRLDLAIDDGAGTIEFDTVHEAVATRQAVTRSSVWDLRERHTRAGIARTLYVGARQSSAMMRCYDKGMQLGEGKSWLRFEFEFKKERADALARTLAYEGWDKAVGSVRSFIEFKDPAHKTKDRTRRRPAAWWVELISASKHVIQLEKAAAASLLKAWNWLRRQTGQSIAAILEHEGGDISWLLEIAEDGKRKWTEKHLLMLQAG